MGGRHAGTYKPRAQCRVRRAPPQYVVEQDVLQLARVWRVVDGLAGGYRLAVLLAAVPLPEVL